jgi:hypothetical protein
MGPNYTRETTTVLDDCHNDELKLHSTEARHRREKKKGESPDSLIFFSTWRNGRILTTEYAVSWPAEIVQMSVCNTKDATVKHVVRETDLGSRH